MRRKITLTIIIFLICLISIIIFAKPNREIKETQKENNYSFISMMLEGENGEYQENKDLKLPLSSYLFNAEKSGCENGGTLSWNEEKQKVQASLLTSDKCYAFFDKRERNFEYTNTIQEYVVPQNGTYKLEVWGAQGGVMDLNKEIGGLGGYSVGEINLKENEKIYIVVGGQGETYNEIGSFKNREYLGGYNGGGNGGGVPADSTSFQYALGGGGATHIAKINGLLSTLETKQEQLLIVAGGGGGNGGSTPEAYGGSGGGFQGVNGINTVAPYEKTTYFGTGANQEKGGDDIYFTDKDALGTFGQGGKYFKDPADNFRCASGAGGGGGYYGGGGSSRGHAGGGGGSGYIGNPLLKNKAMYCYQCQESNDESIKTYTTNDVSETPISKYAKRGNGAAKITFISN